MKTFVVVVMVYFITVFLMSLIVTTLGDFPVKRSRISYAIDALECAIFAAWALVVLCR